MFLITCQRAKILYLQKNYYKILVTNVKHIMIHTFSKMFLFKINMQDWVLCVDNISLMYFVPFLYLVRLYQSTRNIKIIMFLGSKVLRVRRDDNPTAICEPIV
jgi:hypothetical protein